MIFFMKNHWKCFYSYKMNTNFVSKSWNASLWMIVIIWAQIDSSSSITCWNQQQSFSELITHNFFWIIQCCYCLKIHKFIRIWLKELMIVNSQFHECISLQFVNVITLYSSVVILKQDIRSSFQLRLEDRYNLFCILFYNLMSYFFNLINIELILSTKKKRK